MGSDGKLSAEQQLYLEKPSDIPHKFKEVQQGQSIEY